jgi:hypothetical protein
MEWVTGMPWNQWPGSRGIRTDPDWKFHKGKFTKRISQYFDYKAERNDRGA